MLKKKYFTYFLYFGLIIMAFACNKKSTIDYSTQVKPILNKKCIACHGGVKKQGGFSLLFEDEALAKAKSGKYAIVPGDAHASEMIRRLTLKDPEERMPLEADPLTDEEINILTTWINEGAKWGEHWAYQAVNNTEIPESKTKYENPIDNFIEAKAIENKLEMSPQADAPTLARRLSLDIIGLPGLEKTRNQYLSNPSEKNYNAFVDSLLEAPQYGEKWTSMWLDLARYADTKGYERDGERYIWKYRDWLIKAFNEDKPYDKFLTEQLAGDLLPDPSDQQLVATAFHRNTMTNDEGGTDNEEYRTAAVVDRVNTTWETLMGTSFACVQCHSHPYDPFKHNEYYKFMAFFNNSRDEDSFGDYPVLRHFDEKQSLELNSLNEWAQKNANKKDASKLIKFIKTLQPSYNSLITDSFANAELADTKWLAMRNNSSARLKKVDLTNKTSLILRLKFWDKKGLVTIKKGSLKGSTIGQINLNKFKSEGSWIIEEVPLLATEGVHDLYFTFNSAYLTDPLASGVMFDWFHFEEPFPAKNKPDAKKQISLYWNLLRTNTPSTPIMVENPTDFSRKTHVFNRGSWLSLGEMVSPNTPAILGNLTKDMPQNRLGLAMWMTDKKNPLVTRTIVNRVWEQIFGKGLVETLEDMGTQGAKPSHQELLDYLSYRFMHEDNWSLKKLIKLIVTSKTYQQSSHISKEQLEKDPFNEFLARGPRVRLSGEQIRDQALAACNALSTTMYGPPVMPFQPKGIWNSPYSGAKWKKDTNDNQYRRAVYIYWKRTSAYPSMLTFDGVSREVCSSRRIKTNTPLQALVTLNDSVYVDLARIMALKTLQSQKGNIKNAISESYKKITLKNISQDKLAILVKLYTDLEKEFSNKPKDAFALVLNQPKGISLATYAAMTLVTNTIFNLDEVITKT